jgi:hypothetical protein
MSSSTVRANPHRRSTSILGLTSPAEKTDSSSQAPGKIVVAQQQLVKLAGKPKRSPVEKVDVSQLEAELRGAYTSRLRDAIRIPGKEARQEELDIITKDATGTLAEKHGDKAVFIGKILHDIERTNCARWCSGAFAPTAASPTRSAPSRSKSACSRARTARACSRAARRRRWS